MTERNAHPLRKYATRSASISDVAVRAGVSIATVSRVVNGVANKASSETVERVHRAIAELGYRPGSVGRALRRGESRLVAVLAANLANPAMAAIAASTEAALRWAGLVMVLCDTHDRPELQDEYLLEMRAQFARAIVLLGAVPSRELSAFRSAGEPLVFVNRRAPPEPSAGPAPFVGIDNRAAGAAVAEIVRRRGARFVGLVHSARTSSATADRIDGFLNAWFSSGGDPASIRRIASDALDHLRIGHEAASKLLAANHGERPDAIVCLSDLIAYGVYRRLGEEGVKVPDHCLVTGFDDSPLNDWIAPWLTSVGIPYEAYGGAILSAVERLGAGLAGLPTLLPYRLAIRGYDLAKVD